jgi:hypothetical protein
MSRERAQDAGFQSVHPPKGSANIGIQGKDLHPRQFGTMVRNIERSVRMGSDTDIEEGKLWYPRAQEIAHEIGGGDIRKGAGILAVTSPQVPWSENVRMARDIGRTGTTKGFITQETIGKARRMLEGEDPETILPMKQKTGHFYRNIKDPSDPTAVTIDRHAHDLAVGKQWGSQDRGLAAIGRYNTFVDAHMKASQRLSDIGLTPPQTQAVGWVNWRRLHGITD